MSRPAAPYSAGTPMLSPAEMLKFEAPLVALADLSGGDLRKLFYAFFSFLNARTDFYCIAPPPTSSSSAVGGGGGGDGRRMGFREGQAEQILLASFRQFPLRRVAPPPPPSHPRPGPAEAKAKAKANAAVEPPSAAREDDGPPEGSPSSPSSSSGGGPKIPASSPPVDATSEDASPGVGDDDDAETTTTNTTTAAVASVGSDVDADVVAALPRFGATGKRSAARYTDLGERVLDDDDDDDDDDAETTTTATTTTSDADTDAAVAFLRSSGGGETRKSGSSSSSSSSVRYTDEGKQVPVGNGGSTSRYVWTQTLDEVTVHVPLPDGTRAKDLDVRIGANSLSIRRRRGGGTREDDDDDAPSLEGTLFARVRPSESTWTLESNDADGRRRSTQSSRRPIATLQIVLEKVQKTWWETVISGDTPLIDATMVDSTRHIGTYDDETQAEIRRIMFDQRQERLGLPTSQRGATMTTLGGDLPPLPPPDGEKKFAGGAVSLPSGVEYIDGETLDRAYSTASKNENEGGG